MTSKILKAYFFVSLLSIAFALQSFEVVTKVLKDIPDDLDTQPFVKVGNKLYYFGQNRVTWFKALLICRSLGGNLASFNTREELESLSNYMVNVIKTYQWWWLSGCDLDSEGDYYWYSTGERISYGGWSYGQPDNAAGNESCMSLWLQDKKYEANDYNCKEPIYFICEAEKPKTITLSIK